MTKSHGGPIEQRRNRWWSALGATAIFIVLGLALAPGLTHRQPDAVEPSYRGVGLERTTSARKPSQSPPRNFPIAAVETGPASEPENRGFDCMISPNEVIEMGSAITGLIDQILVERSDFVEAGQVVARLESSVEQAAVRVAQARAQHKVELDSSKVNLELGEKRRTRARELFRGNSISLDLREEVETDATLAALELERARERHILANLELEQASASLGRRTIRSPVAGFVVERLMAPGEVVEEDTILRIAQVDPLRVEVILPSHMFGRVRPGDRAEIVPEAPVDQPRAAEVRIVDRIIDGASGTFGAQLILPNPDHELPAGLRCKLSFLGDSEVQAR